MIIPMVCVKNITHSCFKNIFYLEESTRASNRSMSGNFDNAFRNSRVWGRFTPLKVNHISKQLTKYTDFVSDENDRFNLAKYVGRFWNSSIHISSKAKQTEKQKISYKKNAPYFIAGHNKPNKLSGIYIEW